MIKTVCESLQAQGAKFNTASHGLGYALFAVFEDVFNACADAQISLRIIGADHCFIKMCASLFTAH